MKKLSLMILAGFVAFSCAKDPAELGNGQGKAGVEVTFTTGEFEQVGTRATSESAIKDITVLQFKNGILVANILLENKMFSRSVELEGLQAMPATTVDEKGAIVANDQENVILFIANYKANNNDTEIPGLVLNATTYKSLGELGSNVKIKLANAAAINAIEYIPMTGFYLGGIVAGATNQINVPMARKMAKINFNLNIDNFKDGVDQVSVFINKLSLCDVPTEMTIFTANRPALPVGDNAGLWPNNPTPYPTYAASDFVNFDPEFNPAFNQSTGDKNRNFVAYMPENARGELAGVTSNKLKYPGQPGAVLTTSGMTYMLVDLTYITKAGVTKDATYKIFLGGNDKGDMNIIGNAQYNVTTYLYGANQSDTRIEVTTIFDGTNTTGGLDYGTLTPQPNANSYMIDATALPTNFTIPISQARIGWDYMTRNAAAEGLSLTSDLDAFDALIKGTDWEIVTLWKTWNTAPAITGVKETSITGGAKGESNYFATLTFDTGIPQGSNAVIALVKKSTYNPATPATNEIFWTWHLWFTDYAPTLGATAANGEVHQYFGQSFSVSGINNGKYIMDRNFGATHTGGTINAQPATVAAAVATYGMMYQWGRKDPFTPNVDGNTAAATNHAVKIYKADGTAYDAAPDGAVVGAGLDGFPKIANTTLDNKLVESTMSPMNYYYSASDWTSKNDGLWSKNAKTVFDPCPAGWRVPAGGNDAAFNPWAGFADNIAGSISSITTAAAGTNVFTWKAQLAGQVGTAGRLYDRGAQDASGVKAWYPASGSRSTASGAFGSVGAYGYFWSSSVTGTNANCYFHFFNAINVTPANNNTRASGFPVRCIQE